MWWVIRRKNRYLGYSLNMCLMNKDRFVILNRIRMSIKLLNKLIEQWYCISHCVLQILSCDIPFILSILYLYAMNHSLWLMKYFLWSSTICQCITLNLFIAIPSSTSYSVSTGKKCRAMIRIQYSVLDMVKLCWIGV